MRTTTTRSLLRWAFCIACGVGLTYALPPDGWWPALVALAPLFALVARAGRSREALGSGFAFGLGFFTLHILWLPSSFAVDFGPGFWAVFPPLIGILSLFWGLTAWGAWRLAGGRTGHPPGRAALLTLPVLWVLVEWARTQGYFAFPWGTLGYAWLDTPPAQLAEYVGVYGLSLLATTCCALVAWPFSKVRGAPGARRTAAVTGDALTAALLVASVLGFAFWQGAVIDASAFLAQQGALGPDGKRALLVQGDVDPFARASMAQRELEVHLDLTEEGAADAGSVDLVVWPEGAVTGYALQPSDAALLRSIITETAPGATFIVGGRAYEGLTGSSHNSLFSISGSAVLGRYDKQYLVPFGEQWPLVEPLSGLYEAVFGAFGLPLMANTLVGKDLGPLPVDGGEVAAFICYESVFPQVQRSLVERGGAVLVLGTNDAWFGVGDGALQHFDMGRLRTIETRRWLLRAGNDGVTAAVDPYGRVTHVLTRHVEGVLAVEYEPLTGLTFWVRYGQFTPLVLAVWLLLLWPVLALAGRRRSRPARGVA